MADRWESVERAWGPWRHRVGLGVLDMRLLRCYGGCLRAAGFGGRVGELSATPGRGISRLPPGCQGNGGRKLSVVDEELEAIAR